MSGWIKMPPSRKVDLGPGHIVLDWNPAPPKRERPQFSVHVYSGRPSHLLLSTCFHSGIKSLDVELNCRSVARLQT